MYVLYVLLNFTYLLTYLLTYYISKHNLDVAFFWHLHAF